jgi:hypothetical protein
VWLGVCVCLGREGCCLLATSLVLYTGLLDGKLEMVLLNNRNSSMKPHTPILVLLSANHRLLHSKFAVVYPKPEGLNRVQISKNE